MNKPEAPCSDDPTYSFSSCIFHYISTNIGCHIGWIDSSMKSTLPNCTNWTDINAYDNQLAVVAAMSWFEITKTTGCYTSCTVRTFTFAECKAMKVSWRHDWSSSFYLAAETTEVTKTEEFWVYDLTDAITGIGGALGLFLGWSVLYMVQKIATCMKAVCFCLRSK